MGIETKDSYKESLLIYFSGYKPDKNLGRETETTYRKREQKTWVDKVAEVVTSFSYFHSKCFHSWELISVAICYTTLDVFYIYKDKTKRRRKKTSEKSCVSKNGV